MQPEFSVKLLDDTSWTIGDQQQPEEMKHNSTPLMEQQAYQPTSKNQQIKRQLEMYKCHFGS